MGHNDQATYWTTVGHNDQATYWTTVGHNDQATYWTTVGLRLDFRCGTERSPLHSMKFDSRPQPISYLVATYGVFFQAKAVGA
jgi:hypothetical protein